jgi:hypothetical protein
MMAFHEWQKEVAIIAVAAENLIQTVNRLPVR